MLAVGTPAVQVLGAVTAAVALGTAIALSTWSSRPILPALLLPVASTILVVFVIRAGYLGWRRGGILWRGTLYKTETLRSGARLRFP